ncbi:MAG TPA: MbnP family protein [Cytophagaceae bacterium]|jgi:hypothetical protein|nr:MbnP family protein [Cytophagaceae bacterium]
MKTPRIFLIFTAIGISALSCKKSVEPPQPEPAKGTLNFHLHTYLGIEEVDAYNIVYTMLDGRQVSLSLAELYLSGIELIKADGSIYPINDTIIFKTREIETYVVAKVPPGNYKSVRFKVGLNPATNLKTPSSSASDVLNKPEMWFGATTQPDGYVFLNLQGKIDTSAAANLSASQMTPFTYKIGTNANYKQVNMPDQTFAVLSNQTQFVHLIIDYYQLFNGVQLNNSTNITITNSADNSTTLATKIVNNIPSMFSYE